MNYKKQTIFLIIIATVVRCITAGSIELGNDEVYYRMYAQQLQWNYFDHPPMVGWLIRFTTANLVLDKELFIRLGAILSAAAATWLFYLCGKKAGNGYAGFLSAIIYNCTIYGSIIAGTFILPDSPQMVCWAGALYLLLCITEGSAITPLKKQNLFWFGVVCGIGMLCKIHTSFLWLGFILYIICYNRQWFKQPVVYIAALVTILFFYPVIQWNINNHFVTYLYHSNRVNVSNSGLHADSFITFEAGQLFYFNPVIYILIIIATIKAFKNKLGIPLSQKRLLLFTSLPLIIVATVLSLFKDVLPHWTGPAYSGLIILTAIFFADKKQEALLPKPLLPTSLKIALGFIVVLIFTGVLMVNFFPGTMGKKEELKMGEGDFTLDMHGWQDIRPAVNTIIKKEEAEGRIKKNAVIISNKWFTAAHLDYYVAMPLQKSLLGIADTSDIHQYAWLNTTRQKLQPGDDAYCMVTSENYFDVKETYGTRFTSIYLAGTIIQQRIGKPCRKVYVYGLQHFLGSIKMQVSR